MTATDTTAYDKIAESLAWLAANPEFEEKPATLLEFLGPEYLNVESTTRDAIKRELTNIIGEEVSAERITAFPFAMITGGIGIGKTTISSIVLPYLCHWVLCLRDPQKFFNLMPGSRIAFMQMSTSEKQVLEVVFGDIKARIDHAPWFEKYPYDRKFTNQIRFEKEVWVLPGDSAETTFEGYNILGGILEEADSHKVTKEKDYAEEGYTTINSRVESRFGRIERKVTDPDGTVRSEYRPYGFLLVIGQMKKSVGFAAKKYQEFTARDDAYAVRMAIWESLGWDKFLLPDGTRDSFFYDTRRKIVIPNEVAKAEGFSNDHMIEVPTAYRNSFDNNPEKALRDLAGIPPAVGDPFISLVSKIEDARNRWVNRNPGLFSPVDIEGKLEDWFRSLDPLKRVVHIDIAYSAQGDALGFAMGHVREVVEIDGEYKPYIVFDMLMRMTAPPGGEIFLGNVRHLVYLLRDQLKFRIVTATLDGFQSTDTFQQFRRRRIATELVSVDRTLTPYYDLREALYEDRIEFPKYMVHLRRGETEKTEIALKELMELTDNGTKVDHPIGGSKDVADAMAGCTYTLMGDRSFHKRVVNMETARQKRAAAGGMSHHAYLGDQGLHAPVPPTNSTRGFR